MIPRIPKRHLRVLNSKTAEVHAAFDERGAPEGSRCVKGCNACCRQLVEVSISEALLIAERYTSLLLSKRAELKTQAAAAEALLRAERLGGEVAAADLDAMKDALTRMADVWWREKRTCVLLTPEGLCGIYEHRPLVCRSYHVTSDPEDCARDETHDVTVVKYHEAEQMARLLLMQDERQTLGAAMFAPLPLALWMALDVTR